MKRNSAASTSPTNIILDQAIIKKVDYRNDHLIVYFTDDSLETVLSRPDDTSVTHTFLYLFIKHFLDSQAQARLDAILGIFTSNIHLKPSCAKSKISCLLSDFDNILDNSSKVEETQQISPRKQTRIKALLANMQARQESYERPNKKFKDFTKQERRAYWRYMKAKNRK